MRRLERDEKIVLLIGVIVITIVLGLGLNKAYWMKEKKEPFKSVTDVSLLVSSIDIEAGDEMNTDVKSYLKGSKSAIENYTLDLSHVNNKKAGTYTAYLKKDKQQLKFLVNVKDTIAPELSVAVKELELWLDGSKNVDFIKNTIQAKAMDKADGDISANITGWPEALHTAGEDVRYKLTVKDAAGNESAVEIVVKYRVPVQEPPAQPNPPANGDNNQPPEQPTPPVTPPVEEQPTPPTT